MRNTRARKRRAKKDPLLGRLGPGEARMVLARLLDEHPAMAAEVDEHASIDPSGLSRVLLS